MRFGIKKTSVPRWPWAIAILAAALMVLGVSRLVDSRKVRQAARETAPFPAVALGGGPDPGEVPPPSSNLDALHPLGAEDLNQRVSVSGEVVGTPEPAGFWLVSDERTLILVRGARAVKSGARQDNLAGVLAALRPGEADRWLEQADVDVEKGWLVSQNLYLKVGTGEPTDTPRTPARRPAARKNR